MASFNQMKRCQRFLTAFSKSRLRLRLRGALRSRYTSRKSFLISYRARCDYDLFTGAQKGFNANKLSVLSSWMKSNVELIRGQLERKNPLQCLHPRPALQTPSASCSRRKAFCAMSIASNMQKTWLCAPYHFPCLATVGVLVILAVKPGADTF